MKINDMSVKNEAKILAYAFNNIDYLEHILNTVSVDFFTNNSKKSVFKMLTMYYKKFQGIITTDFVENLYKNKQITDDIKVCFAIEKQNIECSKINDIADLKATIESVRQTKLQNMKMAMISKFMDNQNVDLTLDMQNILEFQSQIQQVKNNTVDFYDADKRFEAYTNQELQFDLTKTGFKAIDNAIAGLKTGELTYVIGRKGAGKSVFMLNLGYNFWKQEKNTIFFTLEMSKEDYTRRIDSLATGISSQKLKTANFDEIEKELLKQQLDKVKNGIDDEGNKHYSRLDIVEIRAGVNVNNIKNKVKEMEKKYGVKYECIIVDYAGIMSPTIPQKDDRLKHGQISLELKNFARDNSYIVVSGAQMNREGEKSDTSSTAHVANSDAVSDHIDYGFAIKLDKDIESNQGVIESFKTRDGSPFRMDFIKKFEVFKIIEDEKNALWDEIGGK